MEHQVFQHSKSLNNIPVKKLEVKIEEIKASNADDKIKTYKIISLNRFSESNVPIEYWDLWMSDFKGDKILLEKYNEYILDLKKSYINGKSMCFCGSHGVGKSMTLTNILKFACLKNYNCLYTTLSDIVSASISNSDEKFIIKKELNTVDFLVIDEFDPRFIGSDNASDLYARTLENVFRTRSQNKLPTLMATNSPNIVQSFSGQLQKSLESLFNGYLENVPVLGKDFRSIK